MRLLRQLMLDVGGRTDDVTRALTRDWVRAWDELSPTWRQALAELTAIAAADGAWPPPWRLARMERLADAVLATSKALDQLAEQVDTTVGGAVRPIVEATGQAEPKLIASQLPASLAETAAATYAARITPTVLDIMVRRAGEQITALTRPLSADAMTAVRNALIRGAALGTGPRAVAADMLRRVEGAFNGGGLARATNIARTELLDAYRTTSRYAHHANADVLSGWVWWSQLARNTCSSCWSQHGTEYPLDVPGPLDHQSGRCARVPKLRSWRELGIDLAEPADATPDARALFDALPDADKLNILGPGRLQLLQSGQIDWADLSTLRSTPGWRDSYAPTPLRDLQRRAGS